MKRDTGAWWGGPAPKPAPNSRPQDWPEDYENRPRFRRCALCELYFVGSEKRELCRVCWTHAPLLRDLYRLRRSVEQLREAAFEQLPAWLRKLLRP